MVIADRLPVQSGLPDPRWRPSRRGSVQRPLLKHKPQRRPARGELIDRRLRRFAMGEEAVADHRMTGRQSSAGRGLVAQAHLAQPVDDRPNAPLARTAPSGGWVPEAGLPQAPAAGRAGRTDRENSDRPAPRRAPDAFRSFRGIAGPGCGNLPPSDCAGWPAATPRGQKCRPRWRHSRAARA